MQFDTYNHQNPSYGDWYIHRQEAMKSDYSGATSPPPWKNSPSPSHPLLRHSSDRSSPLNPRAEAIVRGRWELMEMVKNMPETSYELSLKDLVDHHRVEAQTGVEPVDDNQSRIENDQSRQPKESVKVKKIDRTLSLENKGMFLNMVFPVSFKSKKKSRALTVSKVSPKPAGGERDWWKKKFTGSSDSNSSMTTNNSSSSGSSGGRGGSGGGGGGNGRSDTGSRKTNGFFSACWPFYQKRSGKSAE